MSAGFKIGAEVFWGTNGSIQAYLERLGSISSRVLGAEHRLTSFLQHESESFFSGKVVDLGSLPSDARIRQRFLEIFDEATHQMLGDGTFSDLGRIWVADVMGRLRQRLLGLGDE